MNILIEKADTLEYLTETQGWSKKPSEGKNFGALKSAFAVAKKEPIGKFNIVWLLPETQQLINLDHGTGQTPA